MLTAIVARPVDGRVSRELAAELERSVRHLPGGGPRRASTSSAGVREAVLGAYLWARDCDAWTVVQLVRGGETRAGEAS